jgi:hypothetical protein
LARYSVAKENGLMNLELSIHCTQMADWEPSKNAATESYKTNIFLRTAHSA